MPRSCKSFQCRYSAECSSLLLLSTNRLPDAAEFILTSSIDNSYVCSDEGIYADVNNNCEIFHVCHITEHPDGSGADLRQYSFICGNQTVSIASLFKLGIILTHSYISAFLGFQPVLVDLRPPRHRTALRIRTAVFRTQQANPGRPTGRAAAHGC